MISINDYFDSMPQIETERLILRRIEKRDAEDMYEYSSDSHVPEYLLWRAHPSLDYTKKYIKSLKKYYKEHVFFDFAVIYKENGKMIGTCGFSAADEENHCAEIGYVLSRDYWGMGIACEAAREIIRMGFETLGFNRISAKYMIENVRSARVMEKLGMKNEGIQRQAMYVKGSYRDIGCYSILKSEYEK